MRVLCPIPDGFEDGSKRGNPNACPKEYGDLVLEDILGCTPKGSIDVDTREKPIDLPPPGAHHGSSVTGHVLPIIKVNSEGVGQVHGPVADETDVDGDKVLLWGAGQGERMPLDQTDLWATEEDVLTSLEVQVLLTHLHLHHMGRMEDDFGDVGLGPGPPLPGDTFEEVKGTGEDPILPKGSGVPALWLTVRLDHAKGTMKGKETDEDDVEMMSIPKDLIVMGAYALDGGNGDEEKGEEHEVPSPSWT